MSIRVYNDMTRQKEEFVPLHPSLILNVYRIKV